MPTEIDYDQKNQEELTILAVERGVPDVELFRKSELRRLLKAMDLGDQAEVDAVRSAAKERTKKDSTRADDVMARAKANAGQPVATKPRSDKALEKPKPEGVAAQLLVEDSAPAPRQPLFVKGSANDGQAVLDRMRARADGKKPPERPIGVVPRKSLALAALEQAQAHSGARPFEPKAVQHYEVTESTRYFAPHGTFALQAGSIVSELSHDMESLRANGAKLRPIDQTKTTIRYSELGHPVAMKTVPTEQKAG